MLECSKPDPFTLKQFSCADEFLMAMLTLGKPLEVSLVGAFDEAGHGRGSRQDIELALHRDGEYSKELAEQQGGYFTPPTDIDYVGLYCIRGGDEPCWTIVKSKLDTYQFDLRSGRALIFDNKAVLHGRRGPVGSRLLIRMWIKAP